jgi:hypothetical protein
MNTQLFNYENIETKQIGGIKIVKKVSVKKGKGYKSITKYKRGQKINSIKKPIHTKHMNMIKGGRFITGLFNDCKNCRTIKNRK